MGNKNWNEKFIKYIEENLTEDISVQTISAAFSYSKFHFSRLFKEQMGISVMEYVSKRRLAVASEKILGGARIIDVAMEYGWQSHSGFSKSFRTEFGFSPSFLKAVRIELNVLGGNTMNQIYLKSVAKYETKENLIKLLEMTLMNNEIKLEKTFYEIIECADKVYVGLKRYSGEEYITHPLNVAIILAQLEADIYTVEAGLFCDAAKQSKNFSMSLLENFPKKVQQIVQELTQTTLENLEQMSDEVLLIKIAERLHNMRTIDFMDVCQKKLKAQETVNVFMPIARRLKNDKLLAELNDISIRNL